MSIVTSHPLPSYSFQPSWDETIVPTLRKRLESESIALSKRISAVSLSSSDDLPVQHSYNSNSTISSQDTVVHDHRHGPDDHKNMRPSAIPRPSLQNSRNNTDEIAGPSSSSNHYTPNGRPIIRQRTYSQPYVYEEVAMNIIRPSVEPLTSLLPTPASSRPSSPVSRPYIYQPQQDDHHPRSTGAGAHAPRQSSLNIKPPPDNLLNNDMHSARSQKSNFSTIRTYRQRDSVILQEQAPFTVNSSQSSFHDNVDFPSRPSVDEEHPFEHWYRGEVSRNGGVGELRVARRKEMLDIANYGHILRQHTSRSLNPNSSMPYSARRLRPDSINARGSFYLEDYDISHADTVLDEMPLTDLDVDTETDHDTTYTHNYEVKQTSIESAPVTTTASRLTPPSRLPTPARNQSVQNPSSTQVSEIYTRGLSSPPDIPPTSSLRARSAVQGIPQSQSLSAAQKSKRGRTKSPPANVNKKPKSTQYKRSKSAIDVRRHTDDDGDTFAMDFPDGMADAIPSWTQPILKSGNWDDVVLPVVARKMGLEDQYIQADGSPRPQKAEDAIPPPAPGTFGFDHSKYRRAMDAAQKRGVTPMNEFGQYPHLQDEKIINGDEKENSLVALNTDVSSFRRREVAPPSPAPFSHYAPLAPEPVTERSRESRFVDEAAVPTTTVERVEESAGCCGGCVIM